MPTPMYLFIGFIAIGLIFFFSGCIVAAKPASGTTEWINYKCGRKFTFCPPLKPLTKFDIISILILLLATAGIVLLNAAFIPQLSENTSHIAALLNISLFPIGTGYVYPSHLLFVITILFLYIFLKNITGSYIIPISGIILLLFDNTSLLLSHDFTTVGTTLFLLIAYYFAYRYVSASKRHYHFLGIGLSIGLAISINALASIYTVGIIAIFVIKEVLHYRSRKNKQQIVINIVLFVILCLILPLIIYLAITIFSEYTSFIDSLSNALKTFASQFSSFKLSSFPKLSELNLMIFVGGIFAIPCCIYQAVTVKDGNSLFAIIPFIIYIIHAVFSGFTGLLPIFAIPVIACSFTALHNRKLKGWIIAYLITAILYIVSLYIFSAI